MKIHWAWRTMYMAAFLFYASLASLAFLYEEMQSGWLFAGLGLAAGLVSLLSQSFVTADDEKVRVYSPPFGTFQIRWDEIYRIETNGDGFVFWGAHQKRLGFNVLMGDNKKQALLDFITYQIFIHQIIFKPVDKLPTARPKNTRVTRR